MKQFLTVIAVCVLALTTVAAAAEKIAPPQTVLPKVFCRMDADRQAAADVERRPG